MSNGPTDGINNLLKRVKRVAFGFTNFENLRIRALLYAGRPNLRVLELHGGDVNWRTAGLTLLKPGEPNWRVLGSIVVR